MLVTPTLVRNEILDLLVRQCHGADLFCLGRKELLRKDAWREGIGRTTRFLGTKGQTRVVLRAVKNLPVGSWRSGTQGHVDVVGVFEVQTHGFGRFCRVTIPDCEIDVSVLPEQLFRVAPFAGNPHAGVEKNLKVSEEDTRRDEEANSVLRGLGHGQMEIDISLEARLIFGNILLHLPHDFRQVLDIRIRGILRGEFSIANLEVVASLDDLLEELRVLLKHPLQHAGRYGRRILRDESSIALPDFNKPQRL